MHVYKDRYIIKCGSIICLSLDKFNLKNLCIMLESMYICILSIKISDGERESFDYAACLSILDKGLSN